MKLAKATKPLQERVNLYSLMLHYQSHMVSCAMQSSACKATETHLSPQGSIQTEDCKIYHPKLPSKYIDPDLGPDLLDGQEIIFKTYGRTIRRQVDELPPRNDIIQFDPVKHQTEEFD
jgi:hypothetical protein